MYAQGIHNPYESLYLKASVSITADIHVMVVSQGPLEETPPSVLAALAHGFEQREVECSKPTHKIRVDFKVDHLLQYIIMDCNINTPYIQWMWTSV